MSRGLAVAPRAQSLTVRHGVNPVLVEARGDAVHLVCASRLLELATLFGQGALHHGRLRQRAVGILKTEKMKTLMEIQN